MPSTSLYVCCVWNNDQPSQGVPVGVPHQNMMLLSATNCTVPYWVAACQVPGFIPAAWKMANFFICTNQKATLRAL